MKVLAFSDLHSNLSALAEIEKKAKKADVIVCAGDFTVFEQGIDHLIQRFSKLKKPFLIVHGNHEEGSIVEFLCRKTKNIKFIHKKPFKIGDVLFVGYGGDGFSFIDESLEYFIDEFSGNPEKKDKLVFVTHAPPYGTKLDVLWNEHHGNKSITKFIKRFKPVLAISGHFHETFGKVDKLGKTFLINPGPAGKIIEI